MLGSLGLLAFVAGMAGVGYLAVLKLFGPIGHRPLLTYSLLGVLLGAQMVSIGFLAELLIAVSARDEANFSIAERVGGLRKITRSGEAPDNGPPKSTPI